ncbi:MAG TPA: nitroreductase family protein [Acidimicrobiales bacterium]|nr:nitroreductase family protein [Acidimicrobiales bacterium]
MDIWEAMYTTRAMRRLDSRPVPEADLWKICEAATKGPSGSNAQPVRWIVVTDADKRAQLGAIYKKCWEPVSKMYGGNIDARDTQQARVFDSANYLGDHMGDAPAIIIPASKNGDPGSVYGALQNLFLAARALGLGTTLTTVHQFAEDEVRAVLGIPSDVKTWAMVPVGYPLGKWGEAKRRPVEDVTYWNGWKATRSRQ